VKRKHGGLEARERLFGHEIKTKKQFRLIPGAFIISRIQCWQRLKVLHEEEDGHLRQAAVNIHGKHPRRER
jgi:hypothetical protein